MKLDISAETAITASFVLSSFFVLSVYIWRPIYKPPYDTKTERLSTVQRTLVEEFEIKMRT